MDVASIDGNHRTSLQAGLDHLDQGITVVDGDLRLGGWNRRFIELLAFPPEMGRVGTLLEDLLRFNGERGEYGPGAVAGRNSARASTGDARGVGEKGPALCPHTPSRQQGGCP